MLIGFDASRAFVPEATGTENYSRSLLKALARADWKNRYRVYLRSQSGKSKWKVKKNSLYTPDFDFTLPKNFVFRFIRPSRLWTQLGLALETWREPVDLLFVPAHTLPILRKRNFGILNSQFSIFNSLRRQTRYVVTIHDLGVEYLPGYHQFPQRYYLDFASRYAARYADAIIAVSAATKRDLINRYKVAAEKVFVVSEGVDRAFFKRQSKSKVESVKKKYKINGNYILFVGTVQPRKNLQMLVEAFAKVVRLSGSRVVGNYKNTPDNLISRKPDNLQLVIAGKLGWDYDEILALPKKLGIGDGVKFLGHVPDADLPALYSGAAVFAFPSLFEGFGLPILEAISCGCPVVASDIPPHREIYNKLSQSRKSKSKVGKNLLYTTHFDFDSKLSVPMVLVKPKDTDGWVDILYQYISQYEKRSTFSIHKFLSPDLFSWERAAIATLQVFDKTLS